MARRRAKSTTGNKQAIVEAFAEMARSKNIDRDLLQGIMEDTFAQMVRKKYGQETDFEIVVNMDRGEIEIYLIREVVETAEEVEEDAHQVTLEEANKGDEEHEVGDEHLTELNLENLAENFGRRMISMAGQMLGQRVREVEKENVIGEYSEKVGEIIVAEVYQVRRSDVYVQHNKVELRMPRAEQIWRERYKKGETLRALLKEARAEEGTASQPEIIISRSDPAFLRKLMEIEIPEIYDGIIEIEAIAREPGERAKVAVMSHDERVDPVGACVGMKGVRIHSIVRELSNESIDVIPFDPEPRAFITRALSPARIKEIAIDEETKTATVLVADDQVSLAIGRGGQNVRLAMKLTGYTIDLVKEGGEDIELVEFKEEIGDAMYDAMIQLDIETAKEFLRHDEDALLAIEGMSPEKLHAIRSSMILEFDENELRDILPQLRSMFAEDGSVPASEGEAAEGEAAEAGDGAATAEASTEVSTEEAAAEAPVSEAAEETPATATTTDAESAVAAEEPATEESAPDTEVAAEEAAAPAAAEPEATEPAAEEAAEEAAPVAEVATEEVVVAEEATATPDGSAEAASKADDEESAG